MGKIAYSRVSYEALLAVGMYDREWNDTHFMKFYQYLLESILRQKVAMALAGCK